MRTAMARPLCPSVHQANHLELIAAGGRRHALREGFHVQGTIGAREVHAGAARARLPDRAHEAFFADVGHDAARPPRARVEELLPG